MYYTYICTIRRYCNSSPYYTYYTPHTHHIYSIPTSATIMNMNAHENALYVLYKHLSSEPLLEWTYSLNAMVMSMKVCICVCVCDWMCVHVYVYMYIYVCVIWCVYICDICVWLYEWCVCVCVSSLHLTNIY